MKIKKSKAERKRDRAILQQYHKKMTEDALNPLYEQFVKWKDGSLPYDELTDFIHQFHKHNQEIWKTFHYFDNEQLIFEAKKNN
ncbi:Ca2+-binding EF-hand superfamily protein [Salirhabdus euzebyi]|uniref:Ca2+-binding EF-hand superfamily protein n=1 Tax=Salirhabdus euzebyi TaxID=394506 RepID=A0A841PXT9_9BACI|nr:hypothetical protein [Salirhabdus euzebyi]MBB6451591.1 Ca2+-binding EF-hand superfamily protein [Salirhabdus euzebyi]